MNKEKLFFNSDYMEGCHPSILKRLEQENMLPHLGYGSDEITLSAKRKIKEYCECPNATIHFLMGGTQTNATMIDALLRYYEGIIAAESSHIACHEAGAVEAKGHKILTLKEKNGKIEAMQIKELMEHFLHDDNHEHMVEPGLVYISFSTEFGTIYSHKELKDLNEVCHKYDLLLYVDGARLGYGLMSEGSNVTLKDIAKYSDVFYIGGTKVGALFGEAVVITNPKLVHRLFSIIKLHGALIAKGWITALQFDTLFTDNLYLSISKHAVDMALKIKEGLKKKGYNIYIDSPSNQQFVIIDNDKKDKLAESVSFDFWENLDAKHTIIRFCTSWATKEENVDKLLKLL